MARHSSRQVFIYNKRLVPADEVPQDHAAFAKLITTKADKYKGKVTTTTSKRAAWDSCLWSRTRNTFPG
jgi:hypothetical protein